MSGRGPYELRCLASILGESGVVILNGNRRPRLSPTKALADAGLVGMAERLALRRRRLRQRPGARQAFLAEEIVQERVAGCVARAESWW